MNPAEQFADRCMAALEPVFKSGIDDWEWNRKQILQTLAGSWLAFNAMQGQQSARAKTSFVPPTLEEVTAHFKEIGYSIDPMGFLAHYQAKGWKISSGVMMKDWRSACMKWKINRWGQSLDKDGFGRTQQNASLGSLQIELERTLEQITAIVRPGGSAWARSASQLSNSEMERYNELSRKRDSLRDKINKF